MEHREIRIDLGQCPAQQRLGALLRTRELDDDGADKHGAAFRRDRLGISVAKVLLGKWPQKKWCDFAARVRHFEVCKDPGDFESIRIFRSHQPKPLADGILVRKETPCKCLIDEDHRGGCLRVLISKVTATYDGHPHGLEKAIADPVPRRKAILI